MTEMRQGLDCLSLKDKCSLARLTGSAFDCSGLVHEIYSRAGPSLYIYCVVYFFMPVDVTPCTRSVNFLLALLHFR